jgi:hypothetical protein
MVLRTTRITVETETLTIVRHAKAAHAWCPGCHAEVDVIALPTTSLSDPETAPQMEQWIKRGRLHLRYSPEGTLQICVPSLLQSSA